jgi:two-component system CheB/CheR fusion protein
MTQSEREQPALVESPQQHLDAQAQPAFIVGIGASAGGLEAFISFFTHMPPGSGMAFVLVQHLDPQQPSLLPELLAPHTAMPMHQVVDQMPIAADNIYLIPPNTTLSIERGILRLAPPTEAHGHRLPIDHFFQALAADQRAQAIGIILSGSGADGTLGLIAIKQQGGMTMAQMPDSAQYNSMPQSAIAHGGVDYILSIAQMPAMLLTYAQHPAKYASLLDTDTPQETDAELHAIYELLRQMTGHDFSHYKPATIMRRIARRMLMRRIDGIADYVALLRQERPEVDQLFQDLLISVTHFFRDPAAFEALASLVIPQLFRDKNSTTPLRVWVPGCASGEEAYTIAILLREHMARLELPPRVQVFATDIDEPALDSARQGRYDARIVEHVSAERLTRFFVQEGQGYQVTKAIRELCLFSVHNLISDPPFAHVDLIVCRNLLIYFDAELQRKLVPLLHYALTAQGYLFLGSSENVAAHTDLFRTIDKQYRIFQHKDLLTHTYTDFPFVQPGRRPMRSQDVGRRTTASGMLDVGATIERILLRHYTPPAAIIDEQGTIVYFSGRTGTYLESPSGAPNLDILAMVHPQLRLALRTAIRAALKSHAPATRENLAITTTDGVQQLHLIVRPLAELGPDAGLMLVIFQEIGTPMSAAQAQALGTSPVIDEPIAQQLAQELQITRDVLETTINELQEANTELTATNEELRSINEELQSAIEELQTSKEEIQSINEELQTVNSELNRKIEELDRMNADQANLFASMQIPAVFLHADGRIARFTPAARAVFRLIESDAGRPITDIVPRFHDGDLAETLATVLHTLTPYNKPVRGHNIDVWWMMRIQPYQTLDNSIDGVVITFSDITDLKHAERERERLLAAVQQARYYAEQIVETVREPLIILDAELHVQSANYAFYQLFRLTRAAVEANLIYDLGDRQWDTPPLRALLGERLNRTTAFADVELTQTFPQIGTRTMLLTARQIEQALDRAPLILLTIQDITDRTQAVAALQQAHDALEARVQQRTSELAEANAVLHEQIGERERAEQSRQQLLRQLVTAQEEERSRISRELHDQMGQDLTVLMLGLKMLRDATPDDSPIHKRLEPLQALSTRIGREVRSLALQLRPPALDDLGLDVTLANYVEEWSARVLIAVDFHTIGLAEQRLPPSIETALYRLTQEALTNVLKHAHATSVSLIIERRADTVHMIVEDNGAGFDVATARRTAHIEHRLGLIGMDERVAHLGGTLTIESALGSGTTVFVRIPLLDDAQAGADETLKDISGG